MRLSRTRASFNQDDDFENSYSYNTFGELIGISQFVRNSNTIKSINYTYNQTSQRTSASRYEELQFIAETTYSYDGIGRLNQIEHNGLSEIFANYAMTYDSASRITSINDAIYDYDSTDQLLGAEYDNQADEAYEYDATGNRTNYTIGANNQILSDGIYNYTYDNEGNRTSKINIETGEATIYTWDNRNRLIAVTINIATTSTTVNYRYDYLNRLASRTVEQLDLPTRQTTQTTQHFIHDGNQIILEFNDNELAQRNFWGANIDELIAVDNLIDEETLWVLADHLNSTRNILRNDNGTISSVASITYDAFGNIVNGTNPINYAYTGKYHDDITNLQWNINRWYDTTTGQWISEDPIGFSAGDTNLYRYVKNAVLTHADPLGTQDGSLSLLDGILRYNPATGRWESGNQNTYDPNSLNLCTDINDITITLFGNSANNWDWNSLFPFLGSNTQSGFMSDFENYLLNHTGNFDDHFKNLDILLDPKNSQFFKEVTPCKNSDTSNTKFKPIFKDGKPGLEITNNGLTLIIQITPDLDLTSMEQFLNRLNINISGDKLDIDGSFKIELLYKY